MFGGSIAGKFTELSLSIFYRWKNDPDIRQYRRDLVFHIASVSYLLDAAHISSLKEGGWCDIC